MTQLQDRIDYVDADTEDKLYEAMRDRFWYPVAYSDELTDSPQGFVLYGKKMVVARLDGQPVVFDDQCLHKGDRAVVGPHRR